MVVASIVEAILSTTSRSILFFKENSDNTEENLDSSAAIILRIINILAFVVSFAVDFLMYPMFVRVYFYFKK